MLENNSTEIKLGDNTIPLTVDIECFINDVRKVEPVFEKGLKYPVVGRAAISYSAPVMNINTSRIHNVYKDLSDGRFFVDVLDSIKYILDIEDVPILDPHGDNPTYTVNNQIKYITK